MGLQYHIPFFILNLRIEVVYIIHPKSRYPKHPRQPGSQVSKKSAADLAVLRAEFMEKQDYLSSLFDQVDSYCYYRDMFPLGSFERFYSPSTDWYDPNVDGVRRPNGLLSVLHDAAEDGRSYNRIIFDDLAEIEKFLDKEFLLIAPVGYSGRRRLSKYAYQIFGFVFDLDNVGTDQIRDLLYEMENKILPQATYIVNSGTGLHVVYLFDNPVPAFPQYYESLTRLKQDLSNIIWNQYTSRDEKKQFQGIFQAFRAVGSPTKLGPEYRVTAYKVGSKTTIHSLNEFADKENRCIFDDWTYTNLQEAQEEWPEWYQRRIIEGRPLGDYKFTEEQRQRRRSWYDAWIARIKKGAFDGNRHYCIGVLFNYAMKAEIPLDDAYQDAMDLLPWLNSLTKKEGNEFTENDILDAVRYYDRKYIKMGRDGIQRLTKIDIGQTERKGRSQSAHLRRARAVQNVDDPDGAWRNKDGRPTKQAQIESWQLANPGGTKYRCAQETGIDPKTIRKWWKG